MGAACIRACPDSGAGRPLPNWRTEVRAGGGMESVGVGPSGMSQFGVTCGGMRQAPGAVALPMLEPLGFTVMISREQAIHRQGEPSEQCHRLMAGCVRTVRLMRDGRRQVGEFLFPGDLLGFDSPPIHDVAAEAVTDCVLRRYPRRLVEAQAARDPVLARRLHDAAAAHLCRTDARALALGCGSVTERVAGFLLEIVERLPADASLCLRLPMQRDDIADHLGLTAETVSRALSRLRRGAVIALSGSRLQVLDLTSLQALSG
jgi:CRP/FNR family transcriptional regulator, nitrogen fixation regulation protein